MTQSNTADLQPSTLVELLRSRAQRQPERTAYTFIAAGGSDEVSLTYAELDQQARALGAWLQSRCAICERALLVFPSGLQYVAAFFGCLYAGVVAVPAYPPRLNRHLTRLQAIAADARATVVLTTTAILGAVEPLLVGASELRALTWLATDRLDSGLDDAWRDPALSTDAVAFLQYTSGSTGLPKGVM